MRYWVLCGSLAISAFVSLQILFSCIAALIWKLRGGSDWLPGQKSRLLFAAQVWPVAGALAGVALLVLPAFVKNEPSQTNEPVGPLLIFLATLGIAACVVCLWRLYNSWSGTNKTLLDWQRQSSPTRIEGLSLQAFITEHDFPVVSVAGIFRPRLYIARQVIEILSPEELSAVVRHEIWHLSAFDNLKRLVYTVCSSLSFFVPGRRSKAEEWYSSVELAADEYAAGRKGEHALDLASALVRIASLVPAKSPCYANAPLSMALAYRSLLEIRVERLVRIAELRGSRNSMRHFGFVNAIADHSIRSGFALLTVLTVLAFQPAVLQLVHEFIEFTVEILR